MRKGEHFLRNVVTPLTGLPDSWTYHGFLCFPRIESRTVIKEELKLKDIEKVTFKWQSIQS